MGKTFLFHGTSTGDADKTLASIYKDGVLSSYADLNRCGQQAGIYFTPYQFTAEMHALGMAQEVGGDMLLLQVEVDLNAKDWDLDHEFTDHSLGLLSQFKSVLNDIPSGSLVINFDNWGGNRTETITNITCSHQYLELTVDRLVPTFPERSGTFSFQLPWQEDKTKLTAAFEKEAINGANMTTRLQALHNYLRETLDTEYTEKLQNVLDQAGTQSMHVKYIGDKGLNVDQYFVKLFEHAQIDSIEYVKVDATQPLRPQVFGRPKQGGNKTQKSKIFQPFD